jgi:hypothetical protein
VKRLALLLALAACGRDAVEEPDAGVCWQTRCTQWTADGHTTCVVWRTEPCAAP